MDENFNQMQKVKICKEEYGKIEYENNTYPNSSLNIYSDNFFTDETFLNQILDMNLNNFFINSQLDDVQNKIFLNSFSRKNEKLLIQMCEYLNKGTGEVFYEFSGLYENTEKTGIPEVLLREYIEELRKQANFLNAKMKILRIFKAKNGFIAEMFIRKNSDKIYMDDENEINIGIYGEESCGKSTLLSVLIYGSLDNGNGNARKKILTSNQEMTNGKTVSISYQVKIFFL